MDDILVAGGGPAGSAAAIAAAMTGAPVHLYDRARTARHKVCGEFISPGAAGILESLGAWGQFRAHGPQRITRCVLHLGRWNKQWRLSECGWGLSRLRLDTLLLDRADGLGARISRGEIVVSRDEQRLVAAFGRCKTAPPGDRLFGFKSHFEGPRDDAVELFFDRAGYVGVSSVEDGLTNVCGLASESVLRAAGFDFDAVVHRSRPLAERISPLRRRIEWLVTGPLSFSMPGRSEKPNHYCAGDALGFVDPFTGSGILHALLTGRLAGLAAARNMPAADYMRQCRRLLRPPFAVSSVLRHLVRWPAAQWAARWIPGQALFDATRANISLTLAR